MVGGDGDEQLDRAFMALADPVRRAIVARLSRGPATVNELAAPFDITKQAVSRHISVLEQAGLVTRTRDAQRRPCISTLPPSNGSPAGSTATGSTPNAATAGWTPCWLRFPTGQQKTQRKDDHEQRTRSRRAGGHAGHGLHPRLRCPVAALFRAHAEPDLVRQWLGPHGVEISLERWDFRAGGGYRYVHSDENSSYAFNGVFHRVREDLVIQTFEFEGAPDMVNIEFLWFEDLGTAQPAARPVDLPEHRRTRRAAVLGDGRRHDGGLRAARRTVAVAAQLPVTEFALISQILRHFWEPAQMAFRFPVSFQENAV